MGRTKKNIAAQNGVVKQDIVGPDSEASLLGCQDEAGLAEGLLAEYAVTAEGGLRLRREPSLDAGILAVLPLGDGVFCDGEPGPEGWLHVCTGRLEGWMLARHLEAIPLPAPACADG